MPELVLGIVALAAVVLSFALAALAVTAARHPELERAGAPPPAETSADHGGAPETLSRILAELEQLTVLRERGTLTAKEFATQKSKLLRSHQ